MLESTTEPPAIGRICDLTLLFVIAWLVTRGRAKDDPPVLETDYSHPYDLNEEGADAPQM